MKLMKTAPKWHADAVDILKKNFGEIHRSFLDSTKKAVWMGLFLQNIKARGKDDGSIPHGQFGPWLKANVPDLHWDTICTYMRLAKECAEKGNFKIMEFPKFANLGELPPAIEKLVEGKTQQQLFLEFKQADPDDFDNNKARRGQLAGSKGLTKAMRAQAAEREEQERLNELEQTITTNTAWLLEISDAKNLGAMDSKLLKKFADACDTAGSFAKRVLAARASEKGGQS